MKKYIIHRTNNVLPSNKGFGLTFCVIFLIFFSIKYYFSNSLNSSYPFLIISGFFLCLAITILMGSTKPSNTLMQQQLLQKLDNIEQKIDFNYNVLNKHLVRIMAYGIKVKEGYVDGVRQPVECLQKHK